MLEHLSTLGLKPDKRYSAEEVKKAWRKKANDAHPDKKGGSKEAFIKVTHAFKMLTNPSYRHKEETKVNPQMPDINLRMQVPVSFEDAFFGRDITINYNRVEIDEKGEPVIKQEQEVLTHTFTLPQGCLDEHEIGMMGYGLKRGEEFGTLSVRVIPNKHPRFHHQGADIITEEKIPLDVMLTGGQVEVQTMYGLKTLKVPAGCQPEQRLIIKKCGVGEYGNHIAIIKPIFPTKDDLKGEAWEGLDINWDLKEETEDERLEKVFITYTTGGF
jgi:DnaJ-class molecular chaperone